MFDEPMDWVRKPQRLTIATLRTSKDSLYLAKQLRSRISLSCGGGRSETEATSGKLLVALIFVEMPAAAAIDPPHGVQQEDEESPQRNELEAPLGELIVAGCGLMAPRALGGGTLARPHGDLNALVVGSESSLVVDESPEAVAAV